MKEDYTQVPTFYLRAKLKKTAFPNGVVVCIMISSKYVKCSVQNVQDYLKSPDYQQEAA
jgi:hypothetical protein